MELKSILKKALLLSTIFLFILSLLEGWLKANNIEGISYIVSASTIPLLIINILLITNAINNTIIKISQDEVEYYKDYEYNYEISEEMRNDSIQNEIIYDEIREFGEIKVKRFLSTLMVFNIIIWTILITFQKELYFLKDYLNNEALNIMSTILLIIDTSYNEKIAKRIVELLYKKRRKHKLKIAI